MAQFDRMLSLPSWERGLKSQHIYQNLHPRGSLPSWERGLKYSDPPFIYGVLSVAPLVGAWIEITDCDRCSLNF